MLIYLIGIALAGTPCDRSAVAGASATVLKEAASTCERLADSGPAARRVSALVTLGVILEESAVLAVSDATPPGLEGEMLAAFQAELQQQFVKPAQIRAAERYDEALRLASRKKVENEDTAFARTRTQALRGNL